MFTIDDMTLSPDLEGLVSEYIIRRCKDLGAIERVRVFRKAASGVATARFRVPDDAQTAIQRFSSTAVIWRMFAAEEMRKRGPERAAEVEEDVLERAVSLGVRVVGEGGLGVLYGQAGHGMVAAGCADIAGMQRLQLGFDGAAYDGRTLRAEAVEAFLWGTSFSPLQLRRRHIDMSTVATNARRNNIALLVVLACVSRPVSECACTALFQNRTYASCPTVNVLWSQVASSTVCFVHSRRCCAAADGETKPEDYGAATLAAPTEEARLEAYAAELEGR